MSDTLVLSSSFEPLQTVTWKRTMCLIWEDKVDVVALHPDRVIHTIDEDIPLPTVIRYKKGVRRRYAARRVRFCRRNVFLRDQGTCQYCGVQLAYNSFDYEHIMPRSRGGATSFLNIVASCKKCNRHKGDRTPEEAGMKLLRKPVAPTYIPGGPEGVPETWQPWMPESWKDFLES